MIILMAMISRGGMSGESNRSIGTGGGGDLPKC